MDGEAAQGVDYAELALRNGDPTTALATLTAVLATGDLEPGSSLALRARRLRASASEGVGDYPAAIAELVSLTADAPRDVEWIGLSLALNRCYRDSGELELAVRAGADAEAEIERHGLRDTEEAIRLTVTIAAAHALRGDLRYSIRMCERAAERAEAIGSDLALASAYWNASLFGSEVGDIPAAIRLSQRALAVFEALDDPRAQGMLHLNLALMELRLSPPDLEVAEHHVSSARAAFAWSEASVQERTKAELAGADIAYLRGDLPVARRMAQECLATAEDNAPGFAASCCVRLGRIAVAEDRWPEARAYFDRAVLYLSSIGQDREIAQSWCEIGELLGAVGDEDAAIDAYRRAGAAAGLALPPPVEISD